MVPLLKISNSAELRFVLPFAPFGVIGGVLTLIVLHNFKMTHLTNGPIFYIISLILGVCISETFLYYKDDRIFFYKESVKILRGGKIKNNVIYNEIRQVKYLKNFNLGGGPSAGKQSYIELELTNDNIERLVFGGFFQIENIRKALTIMERNGVKTVDS